MKHLKTLLSLFVVVSLLCSVLVTPVAFADEDPVLISTNTEAVEEETRVLSDDDARIAERLLAFGVLVESDLDLLADENITRAEFVAWVMRALNIKPAVKDRDYYIDVPSDHWAAGYINEACRLGYISKAERFSPAEAILGIEAYKIILTAMEYKNMADEKGGYPAGYRFAANRLDINKGVKENADGTITRENAMVLMANAVEAPLLDAYKFHQFVPQSVAHGNYMTILNEYKGIDTYEVKIDEVNYVDNQITVTRRGSGAVEKLFIGEYVDITTIIEDEAFIYVSKDETGVLTVEFIDYVGKIEVQYDFISEVDESNDPYKETTVKDFKTILTRNGGEYLDVEEDVVVFLNEERYLPNTAVALVGTFAKIITSDDKVVKIDAYELYEGGIVHKFDGTSIRYAHRDQRTVIIQDINTEINDLRIYLDGQLLKDVTKIKSNMVFDYWTDEKEGFDATKLIIVASSRYSQKVLTGANDKYLELDDKLYEIDPNYGLYVYDNAIQRYVLNGDLYPYFGKKVECFVDDNKCIRYIKVSEAIETMSSFAGVIIGATQPVGFNAKGGEFKIYKLSNGFEEKVYTLNKDVKSSPITFDYARQMASNKQNILNGKTFFWFTINGIGEIIRIEEVPNWNDSPSFAFPTTFSRTNNYNIGGITCRNATIFAIGEEDGMPVVKHLDYDTDIRGGSNGGSIVVTSDYNVLSQPVPNFIMLTGNVDTLTTLNNQTGSRTVLNSVEHLADGTTKVGFLSRWGTTYHITDTEDVPEGIKPWQQWNIKYGYHFNNEARFTDNKPTIDFNNDPETWGAIEGQYLAPDTNSGFYKADKVLYKDQYSIQFMVNGVPTEVIPFYEWCEVYIYDRNAKNKLKVSSSTAIININDGDNVWFNLMGGIGENTHQRLVGDVIYERTGMFNRD